MFKPLALSADKVVRDLELRLAEAETRLNTANIIIAEQNHALAATHAKLKRAEDHLDLVRHLRRVGV